MITESAIDSIAQLMIECYAEEASYTAAERARVLEACNDWQTSRTWNLISRRIRKIAPPLPKSDSFPWLEQIDRMGPATVAVDHDAGLRGEMVDDAELATLE